MTLAALGTSDYLQKLSNWGDEQRNALLVVPSTP